MSQAGITSAGCVDASFVLVVMLIVASENCRVLTLLLV